jgi:predicted HAD superfamily Cof-like phosphohydrolase
MNLPGQASSGDIPHVPSDDRVRLRAALIAEEFFETLHAMFDSEHIETFRTLLLAIAREAPVRVNLVEVADGLCDLAYVIEGTHLEFGMDSGPIAAEVHRSNLLKVGGPKSPLGKQLKPEGWTPPDIEGELRKQGWKP